MAVIEIRGALTIESASLELIAQVDLLLDGRMCWAIISNGTTQSKMAIRSEDGFWTMFDAKMVAADLIRNAMCGHPTGECYCDGHYTKTYGTRQAQPR